LFARYSLGTAHTAISTSTAIANPARQTRQVLHGVFGVPAMGVP
jgi:hypothetical protein